MRPSVILALLASQWILAPSASATTVTFTEFPVSSQFGPGPITAGADGNIWFAEANDDVIGRITSGGAVTQYPLPSPYHEPRGITRGPDGAVWFTETGSGAIGRIDPSGAFSEFPLPALTGPFGIATGADGNLWFTNVESWGIERMTPSGTVTTFPAVLHNAPSGIVAGPDGALWFTEEGVVTGGTGAIGRITTSGSVSQYVLPTPVGDDSGAFGITVGPDGNLWFTWVTLDPTQPLATASASIGRVTPSGTITEFQVSSGKGWPPGGITSGPDGALWFTESGANAIGQISTTGSMTSFAVPTPNAGPADITTGPDGNLWFSEGSASKIGQISLTSATTVPIDIKPGSTTNPIKLSSTGRIPVSILSTSSFDATTVDPASVCFGDAEAPAQRDCTAAHGSLEDGNADGHLDLLLLFEMGQTGIDPGDTRACLTGRTFSGLGVEGCDSIKTL